MLTIVIPIPRFALSFIDKFYINKEVYQYQAKYCSLDNTNDERVCFPMYYELYCK